MDVSSSKHANSRLANFCSTFGVFENILFAPMLLLSGLVKYGVSRYEIGAAVESMIDIQGCLQPTHKGKHD